LVYNSQRRKEFIDGMPQKISLVLASRGPVVLSHIEAEEKTFLL
jgi:hypothetical protein